MRALSVPFLRFWGGMQRGCGRVDGAAAWAGRDEAEILTVPLPFLKATPHTEGDDRYIYCEASNEANDQEREQILKSALEGSSGYYAENGNVDVDHVTMLGYRIGIANPHLYEIGRPAEVRFSGKQSLVKAKLYRGESQAAAMAEYVWSTFPLGMKWFPSVAGDKLARTRVIDPETGFHKAVVTSVLWKSLALSKQPQNLSVPAVSTLGFDEFAKGMLLGASARCDDGEPCAGLCCKAVTALPSPTDAGARVGGAALARQSLHGAQHDGRYAKAASAYIKGLGSNACEHTNRAVSLPAIEDHFRACGGMDESAAHAAAIRLLRQVSEHTSERTTRQAA